MNTIRISELISLNGLDALQNWVATHPDQEILREQLWLLLNERLEYDNANEWAEAVVLCETLALIGWGEKERVDAISHFNGDCWDTYFRTETGDYRFRKGRWRKRKAGWLLFNPEFYPSQDLPDHPAYGWGEYATREFPIVDRDDLPSQRNYARQMPIVMGCIGGSNDASDTVWKIKRQLDSLLREHMTPEVYGDALEFFYFTLNCPFPGNYPENRLKIGAYKSKQKSFYCNLYFNDSFALLTTNQQIDYIESNLFDALTALRKKFQKKRLEYNFEQFSQHLQKAFLALRKTFTRNS